MTSFHSLGLQSYLLEAIKELGYENPTPIQQEVISNLLEKPQDIIALAQTGTGKTAAFGLPLLQYIQIGSYNIQALILAPTRELCLQITDDLLNYSKYLEQIRIIPLYGGTSIEMQMRSLKKGAHIVVATPGRLIDLLQRKALQLNKVNFLVLDEADEMLNMGFANDIQTILSQVPSQRTTLLFSATMPTEIGFIARKYMNNPKEIIVGKRNSGAENIQHIYYTVHAKDKYLLLKRLIDYSPNLYGIIFCRTKKETQEIADKLMHDGYNADALHGDLSQAQRDFVMNRFRLKQINLLVATDVAARGLDVEDLTHVINYNLPDDIEVYTHRSGRTGRAGKKGVSIAIIHLKEKHLIRHIEKNINKKFVIGKIPTGKDICEKQLFHLIDKLERVEVNNDEISPYLPLILKKLDWLEKEEIIKRFVALEFNRFLDIYKNSKDIEVPNESYTKESPQTNKKNFHKLNIQASESSKNGFIKLFINIGKANGFYPNHLIQLINQLDRKKRIKIGRIDLLDTFSFFEIENKDAPKVIASLNELEFEGKKISVDYAHQKK